MFAYAVDVVGEAKLRKRDNHQTEESCPTSRETLKQRQPQKRQESASIEEFKYTSSNTKIKKYLKPPRDNSY